VREIVRGVLEEIRTGLLADPARPAAPTRESLTVLANARIAEHVERLRAPRLRRVINATGVVIHTNLGRSPLSPEVAAHVAHIAQGYATLEYDLERGVRGHRDAIVREWIAGVTGAEDVVVVNNNAAAVLLTATALGAGREVIVSRGELVEIGGGFRIPEILAACGATLVEVGTTNRTHVQDYEKAITERTAFVLKVHRSNFAVTGFVAEASIRALRSLTERHCVPLIEDLGSGAWVDFRDAGLPDEQRPIASLRDGADIVMFSGDKLLGGPQAGVIVGRRSWIEVIRKHPLARALRPGRLVMAALEATVRIYAEGRAAEAIPTVAMLTAKEETLRARAARLLAATRVALGIDGNAEAFGAHDMQVSLARVEGRVGGGAMPTAVLGSWAVAVASSVTVALERTLRAGRPMPVVARVFDGRVLLDVRTIGDDEVDAAAVGLATAMRTAHNSRVREDDRAAGGDSTRSDVFGTEIEE